MNNKFLNKIKYLILPVALVSIFFLFVIPCPVDAIFPIFDPFKKLIHALQPHYGTVTTFVIIVSIVWGIAMGILAAITAILDDIIFKSIELITVQSDMVAVGWDFVSGLTNMLLILIFIALAFSLILKIGGWEIKKILPRLIIVALLLNFSLVFIGMAIDVSNIFYNTFLPPGENLVGIVMEPFFNAGMVSFATQWAAIAARAKLAAAPFLGPFTMLVYVGLVPIVIFPAAMTLIIQTIMFLLLIKIFFLYVFVFGARIFITQILAILSPLAFLCLILPQTKKYWDMWLNWFLGWLLAGIFLLFFLRLGFLIFGVFQEGLPTAITWLSLGEYVVFYLFVYIYLMLLMFIAKKTMPEFAQAIIQSMEGVAKSAAIVGGGKLLLRGLRERAAEVGVAQEQTAKEIERKKERGERLTWKDKLTQGSSKRIKWAYRQAGTTAEREEEILAREDAKHFEALAINDPNELNKKNIKDPEKRLARAIALINAGKAHLVSDKDAAEIIKIGNPDLIKTIGTNYHEQIGADKSFKDQREECEKLPETTEEEKTTKKEKLQKIDIAESITNNLSKKDKEEDRRKEAVQKTFPIKGEKIENIKPTKELAQTMIEFDIPPHQIANFARIHGSEFANVFKQALKEIQNKKGGAKEVAKYLVEERPGLVKYIRTCPTSELELPEKIMEELEKTTTEKEAQRGEQKKTILFDAKGKPLL